MKRLYRSREEKIIEGVCGGIGEYFDIDPVIIRIAWIALTFVAGAGVLAYIIAWIVVPYPKNTKKSSAREKKEDSLDEDKSGFVAGITLIAIGFIILLFTLHTFWIKVLPLLLIALGVILLLKRGSH